MQQRKNHQDTSLQSQDILFYDKTVKSELEFFKFLLFWLTDYRICQNYRNMQMF